MKTLWFLSRVLFHNILVLQMENITQIKVVGILEIQSFYPPTACRPLQIDFKTNKKLLRLCLSHVRLRSQYMF